METIQYSLDNISIDIRKILQIEYNYIDDNLKNIRYKDDKYKLILDNYGSRTCIFIEIKRDFFEINFLDTNTTKFINKNKFYMEIPLLLEKLYTVIVIEQINDSKREIVAIHSPPNAQKNINIITPNII